MLNEVNAIGAERDPQEAEAPEDGKKKTSIYHSIWLSAVTTLICKHPVMWVSDMYSVSTWYSSALVFPCVVQQNRSSMKTLLLVLIKASWKAPRLSGTAILEWDYLGTLHMAYFGPASCCSSIISSSCLFLQSESESLLGYKIIWRDYYST